MAGTTAAYKDAKEQEKQNKEDTEAMAKDLAEGYVTLDGEVIKGTEDELAKLGLTAEEAKKFGEELGSNAEKLKEFGQQMKAREEQEEATY
jgi:hypothetical protein